MFWRCYHIFVFIQILERNRCKRSEQKLLFQCLFEALDEFLRALRRPEGRLGEAAYGSIMFRWCFLGCKIWEEELSWTSRSSRPRRRRWFTWVMPFVWQAESRNLFESKRQSLVNQSFSYFKSQIWDDNYHFLLDINFLLPEKHGHK